MTRCAAPEPTPCTLGQGRFDFIPWPGPVVQFAYRGYAVPVWAADVLPSTSLTPVRMAEVEEGIERMAEQMFRAANSGGESIADALRRMAGSVRR